MEFNRIIKLLRKERGITQKQAAEDLGVSQCRKRAWKRKILYDGFDGSGGAFAAPSQQTGRSQRGVPAFCN